MQFFKLLYFLGLGLARRVQGNPLPTADDAVVTHTTVTTADIVPYNWTTVDVAIPSSNGKEMTVAAQPQTSVVLAVIAANSGIAVAACSTGVPWVCAGTAIAVVIMNFITLFIPSSGPSDASNTKRDMLYSLIGAVHDAWQPTESCSTHCQLKARAAHGVWTHFASATVDGVHHDLHFRQNGTLNGLRAVPRPTTSMKRDDVDDEGGIVAAYFWEDNNQQAFNDFDQSSVGGIAETIDDYMQSNDADIVCSDLLDQDGAVNAGVMTVESGNEELGLTDDQYSEMLAYCLQGDPNVP
ncbi:hypothetical protein N7535_004484 [Penicillium sp. DV-2018c]|nr:hypothetical protein N7535_004484 [Penicillium sp. DV-2018c]